MRTLLFRPRQSLYHRAAAPVLSLMAAIACTPGMGYAQTASTPSTDSTQSANRALADDHIRIGVQDFNARMFREAAHEFEVAYQLAHDPLLLSNIGTARYESGDLSGAREAFTEFLRLSPGAPNYAAIRARLDEVDRRLASSPAAESPSASATASAGPAHAVADSRPLTAAPVFGPVRIAGVVIGAVGIVTAGIGVGLWAGVDADFQACHVAGGCLLQTQPRTLDTVSVTMIYGGAALALGGALLAIFAPSARPQESAHARSVRWTHLAFSPGAGLIAGGEF